MWGWWGGTDRPPKASGRGGVYEPYRGGKKSATRAPCADGMACTRGRKDLGPEATQAIPRARANRRGLLPCRLALRTSLGTRIALFSPPLHTETVEKRTAVRRHQEKCTTPRQDSKRASPQGEARRECAAKAERSECRGGRITGGGGRGGVYEPYPDAHRESVPTTSAAAAVRRRPHPTSRVFAVRSTSTRNHTVCGA